MKQWIKKQQQNNGDIKQEQEIMNTHSITYKSKESKKQERKGAFLKNGQKRATCLYKEKKISSQVRQKI